MKKLIVFILISVCLLCSGYKELMYANDEFQITYLFWTKQEAQGYEYSFYNGINFEYDLSFDEATKFKTLQSVVGEGLLVKKNQSKFIDDFLANNRIKIVQSTPLEDVLIIYGYSPKFEGAIKDNKIMFNVQIAVTKEYVKVGYPIILGSV